MITLEQQHKIALYLQSKKLSSLIFIEVKDHFMLQISELMDQGISFQEAFLKTKISWKHELEMVRADFFSFKIIARIEKEILHQRFRKMTLISFVFAGASFALYYINPNFFTTSQILLTVIWFLLLLYNFIRKNLKFSGYISMSFHPLLVRNIFLGLAVFSFGYYFTKDYWEIIDLQVTKFFFMYSLAIQFQLLYFNSRRVNVLL
jgi:hypothetical protein